MSVIVFINSQKSIVSGVLDEMISSDSEFKDFVTSGGSSRKVNESGSLTNG